MKNRILINQIGYNINAPKRAYATGDVEFFAVVDAVNNENVFTGTPGSPVSIRTWGERVRELDFSGCELAGSFFVRTYAGGTVTRSAPFYIGNTPYTPLCEAISTSFTLNRCGCDTSAIPGGHGHTACHTAELYPAGILSGDLSEGEFLGAARDVTGGFHDSDEYNRSVLNQAVSIALIVYGMRVKDLTGGDKMPWEMPFSYEFTSGIIDEIKYGLDWLLKMQDKDGGVFDGVYTTDSDITNPESDRSVYTIAPKSASAAITFAAVCALCSNVFRRIGNNNKNSGVDNSNADTDNNTDSNNPVKNNIYLTFADRLAEAAIRAWLWYDEHKKHAAGVTAGAVFWALCELLRLTGEEEFAIEAARELETVGPYFFTPSDMSGFGVMAVFFGKGIADLDIRRSIMESLRVRADNLSSKVYSSVITVDHFPRYSNMFICADAIALTVAAVIFRSDDYKSAARRNFDYLCGANPLSKSFITGFGSDPVRHPHEALSASDPDTDPIPGMLVFGATSDRLSDNYLKWQLPKSTPPAKSYGDVPSSRSTNGTNMKIVAMLYFLAVNM